MLRHGGKQPEEIRVFVLRRAIGFDCAGAEAEVFIRYDQVRIDLHFDAQTLAGGASAVRGVERKRARLNFTQREPVVWTGVLLGEEMVYALFALQLRDDHHSFAKFE